MTGRTKFVPRAYAIDFGTSNTLLAAVAPDAVEVNVPIDPVAPDPTVLRSLWYLVDRYECYFGARAMAQYVERGNVGRLLRSLKRFLPAADFQVTYAGASAFTLDDLIGGFLRHLRERANRHFDADVSVALFGRPARFSDDAAADRLAEERLARAARQAGFHSVAFCPEPVAAAHDFAREGGHEQRVLVGDFGGGTSDFTIVRLGTGEFTDRDVLAIGGVSVAGDALDGALMRAKVAHHFGAGARYRVPLGSNILSMPKALLARLSSPADIGLMRRGEVLEFIRSLRACSLGEQAAASLDNLLCLIEDGLGFQLFEAIEHAKRQLSSERLASIDFEYPGLSVHEPVMRGELEAAIQDKVRSIFDCLAETLRRAALGPEQIDVVCLTGGSGRVPLIAEGISAMFPSARIHQLSSMHAVVRGLAERTRSWV